jgi:hypothetical protein
MGQYIVPEMFFIEQEIEKWWLFHIKFSVAFPSILKVYFYRNCERYFSLPRGCI